MGNRLRTKLLALAGVCSLVGGLTLAALPGQAADHLEAPLVQLDGRTDINDIYAFRSPENPDNTVLIMTVNPGAGVLSPTTFDPDGRYIFKIDTDGDARTEKQIRVRFGEPDKYGNQTVRVNGAAGKARGTTGEVIYLPYGGKVTTGVYDDPFFFDFQAFQDQVKGAGGSRTFCDGNEVDFFAGLNTSAIVLEVPSKLITGYDSNIGVWGRTKTSNNDPKRTDRMGRPAIATVLIDDGNEDFFNLHGPRRDVKKHFEEVTNNLLALSGLDGTGYTQEEAEAIAGLLLPDILTIDTASSAGFLNGRQLEDDVIDAELALVTGAAGANGTPVLDSDCVDGNDVPFPGVFPYLAPAHD